MLADVRKAFEPYCELWKRVDDWMVWHKRWMEDSFLSLDPEEVRLLGELPSLDPTYHGLDPSLVQFVSGARRTKLSTVTTAACFLRDRWRGASMWCRRRSRRLDDSSTRTG